VPYTCGMLGQAFVEERVVGAQEIEDAPILAKNAFDEELGLAAERPPEVLVEVREQTHVGCSGVEIAQVEPLRCEVGHQRP
jgi:hypothetical protein